VASTCFDCGALDRFIGSVFLAALVLSLLVAFVPKYAAAIPKSTPKPSTTITKPKPKPSMTSNTSIRLGVHPGAFCSLRCSTTATDSRARWRSA
jgi:hypothetical protein